MCLNFWLHLCVSIAVDQQEVINVLFLTFSWDFLLIPLLFQSSKNDFRRKWDKDEYENLAQKRLNEEREKDREMRRDGEKTLKNKSGREVNSGSDEFDY